jgi:hypothetical protein
VGRLHVRCCAATGLDQNALTSINTSFRAYDSCQLPLLSLVEMLVQWSSSTAVSAAILHALPSWIDTVSSSMDFLVHLSHLAVSAANSQQ